ncbi:response regulator [Flavobacterium sp. 7A]|uniref:response regulator n=1 Tax=Flavobacterium sp. 7A TaxID=2940571 RepID=UPI00222720CB|nr:response regulator [Flavobacterium sp. 7A]MCW2118388.1 PAS domain S-box-containing protein [Flavobacterium sp. 7A]
MKILLLEDNSLDADLTIISLSRLLPNSTIEHASTLLKARSLLSVNNSFDIALLDVNLPDGNGLEILIEIRKQDLSFPVIMLTGAGDEETAVTALKSGAEDYIIKRGDYIANLPEYIHQAIINFKENTFTKSEVIEVLYIEHHAADIDFTIRHCAQYAPYIHIDAIASAKEALLILKNERYKKYKLILMDYRLSGMDALELIKTIRQTIKLKIPIILVTGQGNEELAVQALKLGANDYLTKTENYLIKLPSVIVNCYQLYELKKRQLAQVESESKYRLLADNSGDIIFTLDMDLNYTYISPAVKTMTGYEPEEAIKHKLNDVLTPMSFQKMIKLIENLQSESTTVSSKDCIVNAVELEMYLKDGSTIWTEIKVSLILDKNKNPVGILGVTRDISTRKAISDKLLQLSHAVEQSPTLMELTDNQGNIEYVNPKFTETTGYTLEEVVGKNPSFLKSGFTTDSEYEILWKTISAGKEWQGEFLNKRKDGSLYWVEALISSIKNLDGDITHYLAVKSDITEKKKIVDELLKAKEKAEESDRLKSAFLANISHEIRTPMNGILGFSALLSDPGLGKEEQQEYIKLIQISGARMLNLISEIIDISKIESGMMEVSIQEVNVTEKVNFVFELLKLDAAQKSIKIVNKSNQSFNLFLNTDPEKLYAILTNLVKNAIKYTDNGSVEFGYTIKESTVEFFVKDSGIGIPLDKQAAIFERFIQVDIANIEARHGAGLGLAITKSFVQLLDGKIWLESQIGIGTTFYFSLPYNMQGKKTKLEENSIIKKEQDIVTPLNSKLKILIVDDDAISRKLISKSVNDFGKEIIQAKNGLEAVTKFKENTGIDLILMDVQMPEMNGYEAIKEIRKFDREIIIITQSAFGLTGDREKAILAGSNDYITKPINKSELTLLINNYFFSTKV